MHWDVFDYVAAVVLLAGAVALFALATWKAVSLAHRAAAFVAVATALLLAWVTGAVGIIGSEANDANLMYAGVLGTALVGALVARLQPHGMARTMFLTACAQVLVAMIALAGNLGAEGNAWPWDVMGATTVFTLLWLASAFLFRQAGHRFAR